MISNPDCTSARAVARISVPTWPPRPCTGGALICRWHGLCLDGDTDEFGWRPLPSYDDGVLAWVRLDDVGGEEPLDQPVIPARPTGDTLDAVARMVGTCEPSDIIANRLDPWHGAWYHPYSFTRLEVLTTPTEEADRFLVAVTFRIGRVGVPTVAEFTSPEARTIVMRIVDGEGAGSVVETHATPLGLGPDDRPRTAVIEATVAHSDRTGFKRARHAAPLITGLMRVAAARLWKDDLAYAERRYQLRASVHHHPSRPLRSRGNVGAVCRCGDVAGNTAEHRATKPTGRRPKDFAGKAIRLEHHPLPIAATTVAVGVHRQLEPEPSRQWNVRAQPQQAGRIDVLDAPPVQRLTGVQWRDCDDPDSSSAAPTPRPVQPRSAQAGGAADQPCWEPIDSKTRQSVSTSASTCRSDTCSCSDPPAQTGSVGSGCDGESSISRVATSEWSASCRESVSSASSTASS